MVEVKRTVACHPRGRDGGVYQPPRDFFLGGDIHNTSRGVLACVHRLDLHSGVGQAQAQKEVSRLLQQTALRACEASLHGLAM